MPGSPRLTAHELAALCAVAAGDRSVPPVSRYWLSVYPLIDETSKGWRVTPRGRDFLKRLTTQTHGDVQPVTGARFIAPSSPRAELHH